ncbi:MAG: methylenetetrahydrofolate reductase [Planctomycetota bacterium]|nr:methylenetetrahydrofolate reductase [Planctomycetota bacterium]
MTTPMEVKNQLSQALRAQRLAITAECLPPRGADGAAVKRFVASLPKAVSAVVVAENHEEIRACALSCADLLLKEKVEPILPLVVRDRNRIALQSDVLGAALLGVTNVLCLSGDHQSLGVCPQAAGAFDVDPIQLLQALRAMRDDGVLPGGERLTPAPALFLGAVVHPYLRPMKLNVLQAKKKVAAGAQFLFTHPLWDVAAFVEWMNAMRDAGIPEKAHIVASVRPLASAEQAEALQKRHKADGIPDALLARMRKASAPANEGIALCAELAAKAKDIQGIRGIHVLSAGREDAVAPILEQAGLTRA